MSANTDYGQLVTHHVINTLEWIAGLIGQVFDQLPVHWPEPLRVIVMILIMMVGIALLQHTFALLRFLVAKIVHLPKILFVYWWLKYTSPYDRSGWATIEDIRKCDSLNSVGLSIGQFRSGWFKTIDLFHEGEGHFFTCASPGSGKTTRFIIPAILQMPKGHSMIITDPSGEITAITARDQSSLRDDYYINPFFNDFISSTGLEYKDSGFNPLDFIEDNENIKNHSDIVAQYLSVTGRAESTTYFDDDGKELLSLFIAWMVRYEKPENRNLVFLYKLLRDDPVSTVNRIAASGDQHILYDGKGFSNIAKVKPQWEGVISKAKLATKRYIPGTPLGDHVSKYGGFDPKLLKNEDVDVAVYVLLPSQHLVTNSSWLNMVMGLLGDMVGRAGSERPVKMLLDELPALGFLPDLQSQMRQHRKAGMRCWLFSQSIEALSSDHMYGEKGFKDMLTQCAGKIYFGTLSYELAAYISDLFGKHGVISRSANADSGVALGLTEVPLITPSQAMKLGKDEFFLDYSNMKPVRGRTIPYYKRKKWVDRTDPNPFINKPKKARSQRHGWRTVLR